MDLSAPKIDILGVGMSAVNLETAVDTVDQWLQQDSVERYICGVGAHAIMESRRNPEVCRIQNAADMCVPDGMPLVWMGRFFGHKQTGRVNGPEFMLELLRLSARRGYRNFFFGGKPGVAQRLMTIVEQQFPGAIAAGAITPPFTPFSAEEEMSFIEEINAARPDILWIGLGCPKQLLLMGSWKGKVRARIMIEVGAAFDFLSGQLKQAPRWIQRSGFEWLFRLCMEPSRLWRRYLYAIPTFAFLAAMQTLGIISGKRKNSGR